MRKKDTVFDYIEQIFKVFGFTVICLCGFCVLFGEDAREFSTIFTMGKTGLSAITILQFFLTSVIIVTLRFIFFTDGLIKKLPLAVRTIAMFGFVLMLIILFSIWFDWFPVNMWQPWVMFFLCFGISAGISTAVSVWKEKIENKKMDEALQRLKKEGHGI